ncbi:MAG: recombinase family protein [Lachnospiraceae bacterium]
MQEDSAAANFAAACRAGASCGELLEKGVSGFSYVSARDRDAIQEICSAIRPLTANSRHLLLVFMFDRLGRRDRRDSFVVEWFVRNGIEVWSATEGQQRFDNHVSRQADELHPLLAGLRRATKRPPSVSSRDPPSVWMTEAGLYTGGTVPCGYRQRKRGRVNKRNRDGQRPGHRPGRGRDSAAHIPQVCG